MTNAKDDWIMSPSALQILRAALECIVARGALWPMSIHVDTMKAGSGHCGSCGRSTDYPEPTNQVQFCAWPACDAAKARAALEAAAKAPGIADNDEMHALALAAIQRCVHISENSRETVADAVLVAVDEWMRK